MKRLFTVLAVVLSTAAIWAQSPQRISYQAVIRDATNHLITTQVAIRITILLGPLTPGTEVYIERHITTPNANGLVTIEINGPAVTHDFGIFTDIDWSAGEYYIKTETDINPGDGSNYTITGTNQLLSVPFALYAKTAASYAETDPKVGANTTNYLSKWNGTALIASSVFDNGKIGFGTTSPGGYLEVTDKGDNTPYNLIVLGQTATPNRLRFSSGTNYGIISVGPSIDETKGLTIMHSSGYIGMGKSDPSTKLDVNGIITATGANFTGTTTVPDPVNATDAATKAYVDAILSQLSAKGVIVADADGNIYSTVRIGSQVWMAENLKTTKYRNGELIGTTTPATLDISGETSPKCQWAYDGNESNVATYGRLYTWYAATDSRNVCPTGWHLPSTEEWTTLENFLIANGFNYDGTTAGNKYAKSLASTTLWTSSSTTGAVGNTDYPTKRNATGFTALPGGYRYPNGAFDFIDYYGYWWPASEYDATNAVYRNLYYCNSFVGAGYTTKTYGFSVRCVRD